MIPGFVLGRGLVAILLAGAVTLLFDLDDDLLRNGEPVRVAPDGAQCRVLLDDGHERAWYTTERANCRGIDVGFRLYSYQRDELRRED